MTRYYERFIFSIKMSMEVRDILARQITETPEGRKRGFLEKLQAQNDEFLVELEKPEITTWGGYGPYIQQDAEKLAALQSQTERDLFEESKTASRTINLLKENVRHFEHVPTLTITSDEILHIKKGQIGFHPEPQITDYLYNDGFVRGSEVEGFEQRLGDTWYLTVDSQEGRFFAPVEKIKQVTGVGF